ncbi:NTP transferase domain-containing protein [Ruminococcaceae bacterium OttesenSCG-928-N02]|nr:NTP transferase domain-containing protein [Ruminococcaceae bacterium OttesenSCG-928-N02]
MLLNELLISEEESVLNAMRRLDETGRRILFVAPDGKLKAVITDADTRRFILRKGDLNAPLREAANYSPRSLPVHARATAKEFLQKNSIDAVPLLDEDGCIVDIVFTNDVGLQSGEKVDIPVVVMAGGLGTRLYPYTKILPKPLIPVGEIPIAEHILKRFINAGCSRFHMVVNHRKNMIKSYFSDCGTTYDITWVDEDMPLGTGGGLSLLNGKLDEPFFLTNCDIIVEADYASLYKFHREKGNVITNVCALKQVVIPYGVISLDAQGEVESITEKPQMNFLTSTGLYVVEPRVVQELEQGAAISFPEIMEKYRAQGERIGVYPVSEHSWMDMGQLEELDNMRRRMSET